MRPNSARWVFSFEGNRGALENCIPASLLRPPLVGEPAPVPPSRRATAASASATAAAAASCRCSRSFSLAMSSCRCCSSRKVVTSCPKLAISAHSLRRRRSAAFSACCCLRSLWTDGGGGDDAKLRRCSWRWCASPTETTTSEDGSAPRVTRRLKAEDAAVDDDGGKAGTPGTSTKASSRLSLSAGSSWACGEVVVRARVEGGSLGCVAPLL